MKRFWNNIELHFMVALMGIFILNITAQIIARTFFNTPLFFTEEISRAAFLWMVFLGISYATLYDKHIRITFIMELLPAWLQKGVQIFLHCLAIVIFGWLFYTSIGYLQFSSGVVTPALRISKAYFAAILPLASLLTIVRSLQKIIAIARSFSGRSETA